MKEAFPGVFKEGKRLFTENIKPGKKAYGEKLLPYQGKELREWDPERSKLAAALAKGLKNMPITRGSVVLYLGASTGTTVSHVSDIVGKEGFVYAVEFSERVFRSLLELNRMNIGPLLADARRPEDYEWMEDADVLFVDIAQPDQTEIALRNTLFLKPGGLLMMSIKSQSIDVTKKPEKVYEEEKNKVKSAGFTIAELISLEPYESGHALLVARKPLEYTEVGK